MCISDIGHEFPDIRQLIDVSDLLDVSNRFIHFMFGVDTEESYKECITKIASIGILLSPRMRLMQNDEDPSNVVLKEVLAQKYQSNICNLFLYRIVEFR